MNTGLLYYAALKVTLPAAGGSRGKQTDELWAHTEVYIREGERQNQ